MTNGQADSMESTGMVSGAVNLTINLPEGVQITTVDTSQEETTVSNGNATGTIVAFAGATGPDGWLLCNGAEVNRITYADLFTVIGTDYGVGNANTTFNLPDLRGRFALGKDDMGGISADSVTAVEADELGGSGGAETHTLSIDEMPRHFHQLKQYRGDKDGRRIHLGFPFERTDEPATDLSEDVLDPIGASQAHTNMPPYQTVNYIIKT